jgi:hypothetical protein
LSRAAALLLGAFLLPAAPSPVPAPARAEEGAPALPKHAEAVVVLEGSPTAKDARVAAARVQGPGPFDPDAVLAGGGVAPGEGGRASVPVPAGEGRVLLAAVAPGYAPAIAWATADGEPALLSLLRSAPLDVLVESTPAAELVAEAADAKPVEGAAIEVRPAAGYEEPGAPPLVRRAKTGPDGRARVPDLGRGPFYEVEARAPGFAPGRASQVIPGGTVLRVGLVPAARVVGRVIRVPGGGPVAGARVRGGGVAAATGSDGGFALEDLEPGAVAVEAGKEGMIALDLPVVRVEGGKTATVPDLRLAVLGSVKVIVQGPDGAPVVEVPVRLLPPDGVAALPGGPAAGVTGKDGSVLLSPVVPAAGHRLVIEPPDRFAPRVTDAFAVLPAEAVDLGVQRLDPGGKLAGEVAGPDGVPVPGATLVLFDGEADPLRVAADPAAGGPLRREVEAGADGKFRLERVPQGSRSLLARAPGRLPAASTRIAVAAGREEPPIRLVLRPGAAVTGTLRGPDGAPLRDALLVAIAPLAGTEIGRARSGPGGAFRLEGLPPGACAIRVLLPEEVFPDPLRPLFPALAPSDGLEVRLPSNRTLEGVVVDPSGGPVRGQVVVARFLSVGVPGGPAAALERAKEVERILLGGDGVFATRALPEGRYRVRAESPDGRVASADVEVTADPAPRLTLTLAQGSTVRGRVVTGPAVRNLREVSIRLLLGGRAEASVPAAAVEEAGGFTLPGVPPGEHDLVVSLPGLAPVVLHHLLVPPEGGVVDVGDVLLGQGALLRVRVYSESRAPLADAAVAVSDAAGIRREERTNAAGLALFGGLAAGVHGLEVRVPAGAVLTRPVDVPGDGEIEEVVDLGLDPPGTVQVRREGLPVPGAVVRVLDALRGNGPYAAASEVAADDRGFARLPALPEGPVLVEVTPPGEPPVRLSLTVRNRRLDVVLPADGIDGEVAAAADGRPVPGAVLRAWPADPGEGGAAEVLLARGAGAAADGKGRFRFPSLPPGSWVIEAAARGFGTTRVGGVRVLRGGGSVPVRILLEAAGRLRGTVFDPAGRPVPGAVIEVTDPWTGDLVPGGRRSADSAGTYELGGLAPGTIVVTGRAGGLGASPPEVASLGAGESRSLDLHLVAGGTLEVRVVGPGGRPVADAAVEVRDFFGVVVPPPEAPGGPVDPLFGEGRTGPDGILRIPGLRAGVYLVRARREGLEAEVRVRVDTRGGARAALALVSGDVPK